MGWRQHDCPEDQCEPLHAGCCWPRQRVLAHVSTMSWLPSVGPNHSVRWCATLRQAAPVWKRHRAEEGGCCTAAAAAAGAAPAPAADSRPPSHLQPADLQARARLHAEDADGKLISRHQQQHSAEGAAKHNRQHDPCCLPWGPFTSSAPSTCMAPAASIGTPHTADRSRHCP